MGKGKDEIEEKAEKLTKKMSLNGSDFDNEFLDYDDDYACDFGEIEDEEGGEGEVPEEGGMDPYDEDFEPLPEITKDQEEAELRRAVEEALNDITSERDQAILDAGIILPTPAPKSRKIPVIAATVGGPAAARANISLKVLRLLKAISFTDKGMAEHLGVSKSTFSNIINGKTASQLSGSEQELDKVKELVEIAQKAIDEIESVLYPERFEVNTYEDEVSEYESE